MSLLESYLVVGAEYGMTLQGRGVWETPENLWQAIRHARDSRSALRQAARDDETGTIRLVNEDADSED